MVYFEEVWGFFGVGGVGLLGIFNLGGGWAGFGSGKPPFRANEVGGF